MTVYHGSILEIQNPDVTHSKKYLDFGKGFYVYDLKDDYTGYNVLNFRDPEDDENWLDFGCDCRDGKEDYKKYDIIIGGVANDDVFKSVDMYHRGVWDKQRTLQELKYFRKNNQIAFIKHKAINELLTFSSSYEVEEM